MVSRCVPAVAALDSVGIGLMLSRYNTRRDDFVPLDRESLYSRWEVEDAIAEMGM